MSNLIVRAGSTSSGGDLSPSSQTDALNPADDDRINIGDIWRALLRRRKLVFTTAGTVFVLAIINFVHQRINNPIYAGTFTLLISDPLSNDRLEGTGDGAKFEQLARNQAAYDIPTLIEVLRSPVLLQPLARELNTSTSSLASRINISQPGVGRGGATGILQVRVTGQQPSEMERTLKKLSATYLKAAQQQRKQRLQRQHHHRD